MNGTQEGRACIWYLCRMSDGGEAHKWVFLKPGEAPPDTIEGCPVIREAPVEEELVTWLELRRHRRQELACVKTPKGGDPVLSE